MQRPIKNKKKDNNKKDLKKIILFFFCIFFFFFNGPLHGWPLFLLIIAVVFVLFLLPKFDSKILIASSCGGAPIYLLFIESF